MQLAVDRVPGAHVVRGKALPVLLAGTVAALLLLVTLGISLGAVPVPIADVWRVIAVHVAGVGGGSDPLTDSIVWEFRAPRVALAVVVGAGLAVAGAALQAVVRNPLADPYLLGVSSGASVGAVAVLTVGSAAVGGLSVSVAAFVGAVGALLLVVVLGQRGGVLVPMRVVLAGVAVGYLLAAVTSYLQLRAEPDKLAGVLFWLLGSLAGAEWEQLGVPSICVLACTGWLMVQRRQLNALLVGDESAASLGVDLRWFRVQALVVAAVLTGAVISVAGGVGFVGLMVPHIARLLVGPDHGRLLPLTALLGGVCVVGADIVSRTVEAPMELPLGIVTAVLGVPFLLWLLRRNRLGREIG